METHALRLAGVRLPLLLTRLSGEMPHAHVRFHNYGYRGDHYDDSEGQCLSVSECLVVAFCAVTKTQWCNGDRKRNGVMVIVSAMM